MTTLLEATRLLAERIRSAAKAPSAADEAERIIRSLDEPLRVAIAGRLKAGKSTLLNALVGDELAPTDEGECTSIVTWYQDGITYRVMLHPRDGEARQARFQKEGGAIEVDLGGLLPADVERLVIDWPAQALREMTLIDTPGIESISELASAATIDLLTPEDERAHEADAVLYLMRHVHASDVRFLEAFHDEDLAQATPITAIGILSRADEIGAARLDALESAARIAARYRADPHVRRLCFTVLPVAGLLAKSGATLREAEFQSLRALARRPTSELDELLLSADRFAAGKTAAPVTPVEREGLLERLGLYGVRTAVQLLATGEVANARALSERLVAMSGLEDLRTLLAGCFASRRDVLKARSALLAIENLLRSSSSELEGPADLLAEAERVRASAHELAETRLLGAIRTGAITIPAGEIEATERLIGAYGADPMTRLGLAPGAKDADVRAALTDGLKRWRRRAESPLASPADIDASQILVRTYEGMIAALASSP
jgi:hypothetical protein